MALELGPCGVYFGTAGSEADLGKTQGGVTVTFSQATADLMSDQYGSDPEDQVLTGQSAEIALNLADYTLENLAIALHKTVKSIGSDKGVTGDRVVGTKISTHANSLILKKFVDGVESTDENDWITFPKAAPLGNPEIAFDGSTQRVIKCNFKALPNDDSILYWLGNATAADGGS